MVDIDRKFNDIANIKWWEDSNGIASLSDFIDLVSQTNELDFLLDRVRESDNLSTLSERLRSLDKVVLLDHKATKTRLRLHHFKSGSYDLLHNHRWPFYCKILKGKLKQSLYAGISHDTAAFETVHKTNDTYFLSPDLFHMLEALEDTVTLVLRGPDLLDSATWLNMDDRSQWQHTGGKEDTRKIDLDERALDKVIADVKKYLSGAN